MRILVSGSSGLIGSALVSALSANHEVIRLVRSGHSAADRVVWDPESGLIDSRIRRDWDAVVHLAGENIAAIRWTKAKKHGIRDSRVEGTARLCEQLAQNSTPPKVLVAASGVSYYGSREDAVLDETAGRGSGFLSDVTRDWEAATQGGSRAGIRVVNCRIGMVLAAGGGALQKMLLPFRFGAGGRVGSGRQFVPWIEITDVVGSISHAITTEGLSGAVNLVSPNPVTNSEFTRVLAKVLGRPAVFPLPAFVARIAMGEMADDLLLASCRAVPRKLIESGYWFRFPELEPALRHALMHA